MEPPQFGGWRHRIAQVMPQPVGTASASPNPIGSFKSKMALTRDDIADREFDWFLVDGDGHVALCASGGYGPIPAWVLQHSDPDDTPDDHREELLQCLPEVGGCRVEGEIGWCEEWPALARRGFYIYDWRLWHGPYQRIVVPTVPIQLRQLDEKLAVALRFVTRAGCCFADEPSFSVGDLA